MPPAESGVAGGVRSASVGDSLRAAAARLAAAGVDTPRLDAEILLAAILGVDRSRLVIDREGQAAKVATPQDVGDRLARDAAFDQLLETG